MKLYASVRKNTTTVFCCVTKRMKNLGLMHPSASGCKCSYDALYSQKGYQPVKLTVEKVPTSYFWSVDGKHAKLGRPRGSKPSAR